MPQCNTSIGAIVLAAGSGSRMGRRPKCLLSLDGEPLIQRLLRALIECDIHHIVVVLGHYAEYIEPHIGSFPVLRVHNAEPDAGQNSSLHCGLQALPDDVGNVLVALADQPLIDAADIRDLLDAFQQRPANCDVLVPTTNNLPGNPVLFSAAVRGAILQNDIGYGCKQWQSENRGRVYRWQTNNEHYRIDLDTAADIEAFAAKTGKALHWPLANQ